MLNGTGDHCLSGLLYSIGSLAQMKKCNRGKMVTHNKCLDKYARFVSQVFSTVISKKKKVFSTAFVNS